MVHRIEIATRKGLNEARGEAALAGARTFLSLPVDRIESRDVYKVLADLSDEEIQAVKEEFTDPVTQVSALGKLSSEPFDWLLTVGFLPGVTDNVGRTARSCVHDVIGRDLAENEAVYLPVYRDSIEFTGAQALPASYAKVLFNKGLVIFH